MAQISTKSATMFAHESGRIASNDSVRPPTQISRVDRRTADEAAAVLKLAMLMRRL